MHNCKFRIIKWLFQILIIFSLLVILARSGLMPVVMPENLTDSLIDATDIFFSGERHASPKLLLNEWTDKLTGSRNIHNAKNRLAFARDLLDRWFAWHLKFVRFTANHPDIRKAMPDYRIGFQKELAARILNNRITQNRIFIRLYALDDKRKLIAGFKKDKSGKILSLKQDEVKNIKNVSLDSRGVISINSQDRIVFTTSFLSPARRRKGILVLETSAVMLQKQLEISVTDSDMWIALDSRHLSKPGFSKKTDSFISQIKQDLADKKLKISSLKGQKFIQNKEESRRFFQYKWKPSSADFVLELLLIQPEKDFKSAIKLGAIILIILAIMLLIVLLYRRVSLGIRKYIHEYNIDRELQQLTLQKAVSAGKNLSQATGDAGRVIHEQAVLLENAVHLAAKRRVKVIHSISPASSKKHTVNEQSTVDDFKWIEL